MEGHLIALDPTKNPEYASILEDQQGLSQRSNELNSRLRRFARPLFRVARARKGLVAIGQEIANLQEDYKRWHKRAADFLIRPSLQFPAGSDALASFLHFSSLLRDRVTALHWNISTLEENYARRMGQIQDQRNLLLALSGIAVSLIGLAASLFCG